MEFIIQDRFPKEFRRKYVQSLDRELLVIILATTFLMISMLIYFIRNLPAEAPAESMYKYQKQYASLITNREMPTATLANSGLATVSSFERKSSEEGRGSVGEAGAGGSSRAGAGGGGGGGTSSGAESRLPTAEEMAHAGRRGGYYGGATMTAMEGEVGNVGVLGVLTSGSGYVAGDYVEGLEGQAGAESRRLQDVLAGLDGVRVGQHVGSGDGVASGRRRGGEPADEQSSRGGRRQSRALSIDDLLGSLQPSGRVQFKDIDRNAEFEQPGDNVQQKPLAPKTADDKAKLVRNAQQVQAIVNGHRLAIIDCYKQLLRTQPNIRGKVDVRFAIDSDGRVLWAEISDSTIKDEEMIACILNRIRQWNDFGYGDPTVKEQIYRQSYTFGY